MVGHGKDGADPVPEAAPDPSWISAFSRLENRVLPAWLRPTAGENRVPVALAILAAAGLQSVSYTHL